MTLKKLRLKSTYTHTCTYAQTRKPVIVTIEEGLDRCYVLGVVDHEAEKLGGVSRVDILKPKPNKIKIIKYGVKHSLKKCKEL